MSCPRTVQCLAVMLAVAAMTLQGCGVGVSSTTTGTTTTATTTGTSTTSTGDACLCIFDIDRTLTGKQGDTKDCPANVIQQGVKDSAYGGGDLTLSDFIQHVDKTFCAACYLGTVSMGTGSGEGEHAILHERLSIGPNKKLPSQWSSGCTNVHSPLVISCNDGSKQYAVGGIVKWYANEVGVDFADANVHFFDDRADNIQPFKKLHYNARQIACAKRDNGGAIGLCGATVSDIVQDRGVTLCADSATVLGNSTDFAEMSV